MVSLDKVYASVFEGILGERILDDRRVEVIASRFLVEQSQASGAEVIRR